MLRSSGIQARASCRQGQLGVNLQSAAERCARFAVAGEHQTHLDAATYVAIANQRVLHRAQHRQHEVRVQASPVEPLPRHVSVPPSPPPLASPPSASIAASMNIWRMLVASAPAAPLAPATPALADIPPPPAAEAITVLGPPPLAATGTRPLERELIAKGRQERRRTPNYETRGCSAGALKPQCESAEHSLALLAFFGCSSDWHEEPESLGRSRHFPTVWGRVHQRTYSWKSSCRARV